MQGWIAGVVALVLQKLGAWLGTQLLVWLNKRNETAVSNSEIDAKLKAFKAAYKEAFNGEKVTPEQKAELKKAISDFIRNPDPGGL